MYSLFLQVVRRGTTSGEDASAGSHVNERQNLGKDSAGRGRRRRQRSSSAGSGLQEVDLFQRAWWDRGHEVESGEVVVNDDAFRSSEGWTPHQVKVKTTA